MIDYLQQMLAVREAHLRSAQAEFARTAAALAVIDQELAAVDDELRLIDQQRSAWETQWQKWLREDGVLCRGQEYNLYHLRLSAWESEVREQRAEVGERHRIAQDAVSAARASMMSNQLRADLLKRELAAAKKKWLAQHMGRIESRAIEDLVFHGRVARQAAE
jgi:hypothetical protein